MSPSPFRTIMNYPKIQKNPHLGLKINQNTLPTRMFLNNKLNQKSPNATPNNLFRRSIVQVVNGPHRPCGSCGH